MLFQNDMSIYAKITMYTILSLVIGFALYLIIFFTIISPGFKKLEALSLKNKSEQIFSAVESEIVHLHTFNGDWSNWDNSYNFIKNPSLEFIKSELLHTTFLNSNIHFIAFVNTSGATIWAKAYSSDFSHDIEIDNFSNELIKFRSSALKGTIETSNGPMLFSSRPILNSKGLDSVAGSLIMGRYADNSLMKKLSKQLKMPLKISTKTDTVSSSSGDFSIEILNSDELILHSSFEQFNGKPLFVVHSKSERYIYQKAVSLMRQVTFLLLAVFLAALVSLELFYYNRITKPLKAVTQHLSKINNLNILKEHFPEVKKSCKSEVCTFMRVFNSMLERISSLSAKLKRKNTHLHELAATDQLTKLPNRRYFFEEGIRLWDYSKRVGQPISVILIDVDYFKVYNDTYGHQAGDKALFEVAKSIRSVIHRPLDIAARYGGEEFIIILPDTNESSALSIAETIRQAITNAKIGTSKQITNSYLTASLGLFTAQPSRSDTFDLAVKAADDNLYLAKKYGRNRSIGGKKATS